MIMRRRSAWLSGGVEAAGFEAPHAAGRGRHMRARAKDSAWHCMIMQRRAGATQAPARRP